MDRNRSIRVDPSYFHDVRHGAKTEPGAAGNGNGGPGLLYLMVLCYDPEAIAGPFMSIRWAYDVLCHYCKNNPVIKHGWYRKHLWRYLCKGCGRTFTYVNPVWSAEFFLTSLTNPT